MTHRLRFTGSSDADAFRRRCAEQPYWYHSFYFDNGFEQRGDYDVGRDVASYGFPDDLAGRTVLDVGPGSGWFTAYFEQAGAAVTAVDIRGRCDFDLHGRPGYPDVSTEKPEPDRILPDGRAVYAAPGLGGGFWVMKDLLGLRAEYVNGRVYELRPELFGGRTFDLVFLGSVLMHLRDPIGALGAARSVCRGPLIATASPLRNPWPRRPTMAMPPGAGPGGIFWWSANRACLREWFLAAGFTRVDAGGHVRLRTDRPFLDESGATAAADQKLALIHAQV